QIARREGVIGGKDRGAIRAGGVDGAGVVRGRVVVRVLGGDGDVETIVAGRILWSADRKVIGRRRAEGDRGTGAVDSIRRNAGIKLLAAGGLQEEGEILLTVVVRGERIRCGQPASGVGAAKDDRPLVADANVPRRIPCQDGDVTRTAGSQGRRIAGYGEGDSR